MPGLDPGIHVFLWMAAMKAWMAGILLEDALRAYARP
jgi:hypothetical protein